MSDENTVETRLAGIGETLPAPKTPVANYVGCKQSGDILYVSGRVSEVRGIVGIDLYLDEARIAAKHTLLDLLAITKQEIGSLDLIASVEQLRGFVRSDENFTQQPQVIDGASDLLIKLFGESGRHARTATGTSQLPYGAAVQIDMILRVDM